MTSRKMRLTRKKTKERENGTSLFLLQVFESCSVYMFRILVRSVWIVEKYISSERERDVDEDRNLYRRLDDKLSGARKWGKRAKMIGLSFFIWMITRSRDRSTEVGFESRRDSRRDSVHSRDRADSRETALAIYEQRRHRPRRRHSRRYYVDRNKRWVSGMRCRESSGLASRS